MDKLGIQRRMHISGDNKDAFDPFSPETPQMTVHAQDMLDQIHTQFIDAVKQGCGNCLRDDPELCSGRARRTCSSVSRMASATPSYVAREVIKPDIVDYTQKESISERVVKRFGVSIEKLPCAR